MSTAREELVVDQETSDRFALAETISTWLDSEGLDIEMEFPIFPLAVAILAAGWQSPAQVEAALAAQREGIAMAIMSDPSMRLGRNVGVVCSCLRCEVAHTAAAIARTYTQEAGE